MLLANCVVLWLKSRSIYHNLLRFSCRYVSRLVDTRGTCHSRSIIFINIQQFVGCCVATIKTPRMRERETDGTDLCRCMTALAMHFWNGKLFFSSQLGQIMVWNNKFNPVLRVYQVRRLNTSNIHNCIYYTGIGFPIAINRYLSFIDLASFFFSIFVFLFVWLHR